MSTMIKDVNNFNSTELGQLVNRMSEMSSFSINCIHQHKKQNGINRNHRNSANNEIKCQFCRLLKTLS